MNIVYCIILYILLLKYPGSWVLSFPVELPDTLVGVELYVLKYDYEKGIAILIRSEYISPNKKTKGDRYYIPHYFGILKKGATYRLMKNKEGTLYFIPTVTLSK